jgi:hypothetical protein
VPEVGEELIWLPPWLVPTTAEVAPVKVGVTVSLVAP